MALFKGAGVALATPFKENDEMNYEKLEEVIEEQTTGNTDAITACSTTGKVSTMTHEEHLDVTEYIYRVTKKRIPVVAGADSNCIETTVHLSAEAEKRGADGLLLVSPCCDKATRKGLITHFTAVAGAVKIPVILYSVPGRTGVTIEPETIAALCRGVDNIVGIKEASGNLSATVTLMNLSDGRVDLHSGNNDQIAPLFSLGGKGVISVLSDVAPRQTYDICASYFAGNVKTSAALQLRAIPLIAESFGEVNPIPVKTAMNMIGKGAGPLCMPLIEMEPQDQEKLKKAMTAYGIL